MLNTQSDSISTASLESIDQRSEFLSVILTLSEDGQKELLELGRDLLKRQQSSAA